MASFYRQWAEILPSGIDLLAVCYPGREARFGDPCTEHLTDLADLIADDLMQNTDKPLTLFGHSMGAAVAYEVAKRLEKDGGVPLERLVVSGREAAPHSSGRRSGMHLRSDDALVAEVLRLGGPGAEALNDPELRDLILPRLRADYRMGDNYDPDPTTSLTVPVTAMTGDNDPICTPAGVKAWADATTGSCTVEVFVGGHFYLVPNRSQVINSIVQGW